MKPTIRTLERFLDAVRAHRANRLYHSLAQATAGRLVPLAADLAEYIELPSFAGEMRAVAAIDAALAAVKDRELVRTLETARARALVALADAIVEEPIDAIGAEDDDDLALSPAPAASSAASLIDEARADEAPSRDERAA